MQNLCFGPECTISGTKVPKHPFWSIRPKMMFGSVSEHFANLRHVKDEKIIFRAWMHYFGVPKLWIIHSSPLDLMMFGSVLEHFANLRHVKDAKTVFWAWMHYFEYQSSKASILVYWTQNDVWECFRAFHLPLARKRWITHVSGLNALFRGTKVVKHPF
jgi:hypothetical protein